jgi:hypothetical protein
MHFKELETRIQHDDGQVPTNVPTLVFAGSAQHPDVSNRERVVLFRAAIRRQAPGASRASRGSAGGLSVRGLVFWCSHRHLSKLCGSCAFSQGLQTKTRRSRLTLFREASSKKDCGFVKIRALHRTPGAEKRSGQTGGVGRHGACPSRSGNEEEPLELGPLPAALPCASSPLSAMGGAPCLLRKKDVRDFPLLGAFEK